MAVGGGGLNWKGQALTAKILRASAAGVNETLADAVAQAKNDHPGWNNISTTAEGSVRIVEPARASAGVIEGKWGSVGVEYVWYLEFNHGSFLRNAADATYPTLKQRILRRLA